LKAPKTSKEAKATEEKDAKIKELEAKVKELVGDIKVFCTFCLMLMVLSKEQLLFMYKNDYTHISI